MFDENLFLEDTDFNIKLNDYILKHSDIRKGTNKTEVTVYELPLTDGLAPILSEKYLTLVIHKVAKNEGYYTLQVLGKGFPRLNSTQKERTEFQMVEYITNYFKENETEIKDILQ